MFEGNPANSRGPQDVLEFIYFLLLSRLNNYFPRDEDTSHDLACDGFIKVLKRYGPRNLLEANIAEAMEGSRGKFIRYLCVVAQNLALSEFERRKNRGVTLFGDHVDPYTSFYFEVWTYEMSELISKLSHEEQRVVELRFIHHKKDADIGKEMFPDRSALGQINAARRCRLRALAKLRALLLAA